MVLGGTLAMHCINRIVKIGKGLETVWGAAVPTYYRGRQEARQDRRPPKNIIFAPPVLARGPAKMPGRTAVQKTSHFRTSGSGLWSPSGSRRGPEGAPRARAGGAKVRVFLDGGLAGPLGRSFG